MNELTEKYYAEIVMQEPKKTAPAAGQERLDAGRLSGELKAILEARQPLHIGSGMLVPPEKLGLTASSQLVKEFFRSGRNLRVPGTSLKGALRSLIELYTDSCAPVAGKQRASKEEAHTCQYRSANSRLCPACHIFGALGFQGKVHFDDGRFFKGWRHEIKDIPAQFSYDGHPGKRRYYPHELVDGRARTWPLEVVTPGSKFLLQASFTNLSQAELGVVLIALGQGQWQLCPKIGAGKSAGLGAVQVLELSAEKLALETAYTSFEARMEPIDIAACIRAAQAQSWLRPEVLDTLSRDLSGKKIREAK